MPFEKRILKSSEMTLRDIALHESAHAIIAENAGIPVESVTMIPSATYRACCYVDAAALERNPRGDFLLTAAGTAVKFSGSSDDLLGAIRETSPSDYESCMRAVVRHYANAGWTPPSYVDSPFCRLRCAEAIACVRARAKDINFLATCLEHVNEVSGGFVRSIAHRQAREFGRRWKSQQAERAAQKRAEWEAQGRKWPAHFEIGGVEVR